MIKDLQKKDAQTCNSGKPDPKKGKGAGMKGVSKPGKLGTSVSIVKK